MKRNLVVTSSTTIATSEPDVDIVLAGRAECKRLEAYLYSGAALTAVVHESGPITTHTDGKRTYRVIQRALVTVTSDDRDRCRFLADYQAGRLQSGSFGVEDFVEDIDAARRAVGVVEEDEEPTLAEALSYAIDVLSREEVEYSLGLDSDHLDCSTVLVDGVERPRTEDDLDKELSHHARLIAVLEAALSNINYEVK